MYPKSICKCVIVLGLMSLLWGCYPKVSPVYAPIIIPNITPREVKQKLDVGAEFILLDVRTDEEYAEGHLEGAILIPHNQVQKRYQELNADTGQEIIVYCRSGRRSSLATRILLERGFTDVKNMGGGILAWPYPVVK